MMLMMVLVMIIDIDIDRLQPFQFSLSFLFALHSMFLSNPLPLLHHEDLGTDDDCYNDSAGDDEDDN